MLLLAPLENNTDPINRSFSQTPIFTSGGVGKLRE